MKMTSSKRLTTIFCLSALAVGVAGCVGSETSDTPTRPVVGPGAEEVAAATARAVALAAALDAAKATAADGTFDDAAHMVAPSVTASHDGAAVSVGVSEGGTPQGGSARSGAFVEQEAGPPPVAGWTGARFMRGTAAEALVVYTDVAAPEAMAFTPENLNRLNEVSGLKGETLPEAGLAIEAGYFPLIVSLTLAAASPNGSAVHNVPAAEEGLSFIGTFAGGTGTYSCTGAKCSVTLNDRGGPTAMAGKWRFSPDSGATVEVPDYAHVDFGWWLSGEDEGPYGFQTFAGGTGFAGGSGAVSAAMTGTATYSGAAAGIYAAMDVAGGRVTGGHAGEFTAVATLTARFFGALDAGEVGGDIGSFVNAAGQTMEGWGVTLQSAALKDGQAWFSGSTGGTVGAGTSGAGSWEGTFHGTGGSSADGVPSDVAGRFDVHFPGMHIAGAFGASR